MDATKMREVFTNLIDNAIKYTGRGGVTVRAELVTSSKYNEESIKQDIHDTKYMIHNTDAIRVSISDTGIGIPKDGLPYLFEKFSRGKDTARLHATLPAVLQRCRRAERDWGSMPRHQTLVQG